MSLRARVAWAGLFTAAAVVLPAVPSALGWGANGERLIVNKAVETLPDDLRPYFETNRQFLVQHVTDPGDAAGKNPTERRNQFVRLDHYGQFPFPSLPRDYKTAVTKLGKRTLDMYGRLPWSIGLYSQKLTDSFRLHNWDDVRVNAALLAFYVAEAHDPFNTTMNEDGKLSLQPGVNSRFNVSLVDRYSLFFFVHPNDAVYVRDPTDHAFEMCLSAHSWLENILLADRRSRAGLSDYTDEYYDRFYSQAGAVLVRQISDASTDVGSYWLTAWSYAGKPQLPAR
jgi:hypothetical protein